MFEKEAEEYKLLHTHYEAAKRNDGSEYAKSVINVTIQEAFQQGAEFGYDKANEWHFVKDGDLPKDEDYKWCISSNGIYYVAKYEELFLSWTNQEHKEVCCPYAWKEIIPPKEIK